MEVWGFASCRSRLVDLNKILPESLHSDLPHSKVIQSRCKDVNSKYCRYPFDEDFERVCLVFRNRGWNGPQSEKERKRGRGLRRNPRQGSKTRSEKDLEVGARLARKLPS